jgi:hypothetical protein
MRKRGEEVQLTISRAVHLRLVHTGCTPAPAGERERSDKGEEREQEKGGGEREGVKKVEEH